MKTPAELHALLKDKFGDAILVWEEKAKDPFCVVEPTRLRDIARFLRDDPETRFDFLFCHTAVDHPPATLALVLHLYSYPLRHTFILKTILERANPQVDSLANIWPTADWHEREAYDLFGIQFKGHPDLRRLLLPDDWPGHPMLRDWKEPASYHGIPTTRPDAMELVHLGGLASAPPPPPAPAAPPASPAEGAPTPAAPPPASPAPEAAP